MTYVVCATWIAAEGEEEAVEAAIRKLVEPSRAEPGMRTYVPHRDPKDPRTFFIYEVYDDEAAYQAHLESDHVKQHGFGDAIPRLAERRREFYEPLA